MTTSLTQGVKNRPRIIKKEVKVWNETEANRFLEYVSNIKSRYYIVFYLALMTGMRQGEILGLRWSDIDLEKRRLSVVQVLRHDGSGFKQGAKTTSGNRSIGLDSNTIEALKEHKEFIDEEKKINKNHYVDQDLVVCTHTGFQCKPRFLDKYWNSFRDKAGMRKIKFHDLRHTHASLMLQHNINPKVISERLGHSSIQMTMDLYSHLFPNMQSDAAEILANSIFKKPISIATTDATTE